MNSYDIINILSQRESFISNELQQLNTLLVTYKTNIESNFNLLLMFNNLMISINEFIINRTIDEKLYTEILLFIESVKLIVNQSEAYTLMISIHTEKIITDNEVKIFNSIPGKKFESITNILCKENSRLPYRCNLYFNDKTFAKAFANILNSQSHNFEHLGEISAKYFQCLKINTSEMDKYTLHINHQEGYFTFLVINGLPSFINYNDIQIMLSTCPNLYIETLKKRDSKIIDKTIEIQVRCTNNIDTQLFCNFWNDKCIEPSTIPLKVKITNVKLDLIQKNKLNIKRNFIQEQNSNYSTKKQCTCLNQNSELTIHNSSVIIPET
jgi:hypothetical protein